jgi:(1->4)-alpha-D-glucan 1-alpha-D-glucosylmutase
VPYLASLGISHLYCSPVLAARAGSTHGYDVADPTHVGAELGGDEAFVQLAEAAQANGLGLILDIVPNHMGIGSDNPFWDDVLEHGRNSKYAGWFDVEWKATTRRLAGKVLLPVLGDPLDEVLARDEISVAASDRGVRVRYFSHHFPVDPASLPRELELAMRDPSAREALATWSRGEAGRARLSALLRAQHYQLAFWRTASRDLNYRRFFDVNELIALRVEQAEVFEATHRVVLQMVADGLVDGLRIDHIDGLLEPRRYLERLRAAVDARQPRLEGEPRFPIFVEKILAHGELLPADWPVEGTTGYDFMVTLEDVFVDPAGYERLEARYRDGERPAFPAIALEAKRHVLRGALNADVRRVAPMLAAVARRGGWATRPIGAYAIAIVELIAALPVYRTYLDADHPEPSPADRAVLERAFATVRERGTADVVATAALERVLLDTWSGADVDVGLAHARLAFVLRWQQLTGPAAAKGVEDTALYAYAPLASRNEVGGDPGVPVSGAVDRLHTHLEERATRHPRSLNATNTHDAKRSADVRARLDVLSEDADGWERRLALWRRQHRRNRTLERFVSVLAPQGVWNALSRIAGHLTAPGIPDV